MTKVIRTKRFTELGSREQLAILMQIMRDAGHDPDKWLFEFHNELEQLSVEDLNEVCKTMVSVENFEKAAEIRDIIEQKKQKQQKK